MDRRLLWCCFLLCVFCVESMTDEEADIWATATDFACQCFCMASSFTVHSDKVAHMSSKPVFGFGPEAIPLRGEHDLEFWLGGSRKKQLLYTIENGVPVLHNFATGIVIESPPKLSLKAREVLLNEASDGMYFALKQKYEGEGGSRLRRDLEDLQRRHGISLKSSSSSKKMVHVMSSEKLYASRHRKMEHWDRSCHRVCKEVVDQTYIAMRVADHMELAFLKFPEDPYDEGSWISSEPIHEGEIGVSSEWSSSTKLTAEEQQWTVQIKRMYSPLLRALRSGRKGNDLRHCHSLQERFSEIHGQHVSWSDLARTHGIVRSPKEIDPPGGRVLTRSMNAGIPLVKIKHPTYIEHPPILPVIIGAEVANLGAEAAIRRKLLSIQQEAIEWPKGSPAMFTRQVTPQYKFRARLQGSDVGYKVVSLFTGSQSSQDPGLIEFLLIYIDHLEHESLKASLETILLHHWGKTILQAYLREGSNIGAIRKNKDDDDAQSSASINSGSRNSGDGGSVSSSFLQHKETDDQSTSFLQRDIQPVDFLDIEYVGAVFIGCWHYVANGRIIQADNRLVRTTVPCSDVLLSDGSVIEVPAESDSVAVQFFGAERKGIARLDDGNWIYMIMGCGDCDKRHGVKQEFLDQIQKYRPHEFKVIYRVLANIFRIHQDIEYLERNTCPLDGRRMDVEIGEYCKAETMLLYVEKEPSNLSLKAVTLKGGPLQKVTGEFLTKCFGVVLPSATVVHLKGTPPVKHRSECERTTLGRYLLIEKGPYQQPMITAPLDALPKGIPVQPVGSPARQSRTPQMDVGSSAAESEK